MVRLRRLGTTSLFSSTPTDAENRCDFVKPAAFVLVDLRDGRLSRGLDGTDLWNVVVGVQREIDSLIGNKCSFAQGRDGRISKFVFLVVLVIAVVSIGFFERGLRFRNGQGDRHLGISKAQVMVTPVKVSNRRRPFFVRMKMKK